MPRKPAQDTYARIQQRYPDYFAAVDALGSAARHAGPLDERTLHLIQLGAAAAMRAEGAVHSHVRRARQAGASPAEIHHALLALTSTLGFPAVAAALSWADDILGQE
ncbi:carboxymuconolactone decarboxylase family protein [Pseudomonas oryzae]|uniref:Alkylhydroperoxidase AhpD family core domain-containing protein n=1 Tax=Pseudomonas oryzae TaxID=1392877 RepID=A0A1H1TUZ0_9PSED|nr:carboxymuconolactone decarboxylase family protein [Pseudomonas oryzae]SDS63736.1 alkylhydroperoxidase AhpD family core domain-containing protein [Pseudomonas oryzae]